ncbi:MAG TPA: nuclear transport factor 2 family protein [Acidimicrobiales bacterium]|nr:nuclear transport factor 2 family protein [Acidimicrobiales bacterium]
MGTGAAEEEIRAVINQTLTALNSGDAATMASLLLDSPDAVHIGTDAQEWLTPPDFLKAIEGGFQPGTTASMDDAAVHVLGEVAWSEGRGHFTSSKGEKCPVRVTSVFVREDDQWKVAQSHASIGVPNEQMFG